MNESILLFSISFNLFQRQKFTFKTLVFPSKKFLNSFLTSQRIFWSLKNKFRFYTNRRICYKYLKLTSIKRSRIKIHNETKKARSYVITLKTIQNNELWEHLIKTLKSKINKFVFFYHSFICFNYILIKIYDTTYLLL